MRAKATMKRTLGMGGGLEAWSQRGKTMGIPLLHPWATRLGGWSYDAAGKHVELPSGLAHVRTEEHGLTSTCRGEPTPSLPGEELDAGVTVLQWLRVLRAGGALRALQ